MKRFFAVIAILALFNSTAWALWANPNPQGGGDTAGQLLLKHESNMTDIYTGANGKLNLLKANFSGTSAPSSPDEGQAWFDSTHLTISIYNGSAWIPFASFNKGNTGPTGIWNAPTIYSPTTTGTDSGTQTLTNKTLTSPTINGTPTGTGLPTIVTKYNFNNGDISLTGYYFTSVLASTLGYTVTVPAGWKLIVDADFTAYATAPGTYYPRVALLVNQGGYHSTWCTKDISNSALPGTPIHLRTIVTGDGTSVTVNLGVGMQSGGTVYIESGETGSEYPQITYMLLPSN